MMPQAPVADIADGELGARDPAHRSLHDRDLDTEIAGHAVVEGCGSGGVKRHDDILAARYDQNVVAFVAVGVGSWLAFLLLDRLHQNTARVGRVVDPLRTLVLAVSIVTTPAVVVGVIFIAPIAVMSAGGVGPMVVGGTLVVAGCFVVGLVVERRANAVALRWMSSASPVPESAGPPGVRDVGGGASAAVPSFVIAELSDDDDIDPFVSELLAAQRSERRRRTLLRRVPPALGVLATALWTVAAANASTWVVMGTVTAVATTGAGAILIADNRRAAATFARSPLREVRLGSRSVATMLALVPIALFSLPAIARSSRDSVAQWSDLTDRLGRFTRWIQSGVVVWVVAALAAPFAIAPIVEATRPGIGSMAAGVVFLASSLVLHRWNRAMPASTVRRWGLLVLRVFGSAERSRFLVDVADRWAGIGPANCIAAPDVSIHQIAPGRIADTVFGMERARFVLGPELDGDRGWFRPPPTHRLEEVHCFADAWRNRVRWEASLQGSVVLMDLRGFEQERRGCEFELGVLVDEVPIDTAVLLVDETTDTDAAIDVLRTAWTSMRGGAMNHSRGPTDIVLFRTQSATAETADHVVRRLAGARMRSTTTTVGAAWHTSTRSDEVSGCSRLQPTTNSRTSEVPTRFRGTSSITRWSSTGTSIPGRHFCWPGM